MTSELRATFDTIVIGGGQAGLVVGHELRARGIDFLILDAGARVGDAWRKRWDSLRLFTPARFNGLPGMPYPGPGSRFVDKDEIADYLEAYAEAMELPIRHRSRVTHLAHDGDSYLLTAGGDAYRARNVVVAMADFQVPRVPDFAPDLDPDIVQMHSTQYRNPGQLQPGPTLIVGLGNSGADIAHEVAKHHPTIVSGTESASIPFPLESWFGRNIGTRLVRFVMVRVLNTSTPIGRKARPKMLGKSAPLVRIRPKELARAGVERVDRIGGVVDGLPVTESGQSLEVANVVWCTGYRPGFDWIDIPVFDDTDHPRHHRGIVEESPGLYFVGLFFLHSVWSENLAGVAVDARHVVSHLVRRRPAAAGVT